MALKLADFFLDTGSMPIITIDLMSSRGFVFVVQNWAESDQVALRGASCVYICWGREVAPSTGTPHLQGYVYFKSAKTKSACIKFFTKLGVTCHVIAAKGDAESNAVYSSKDGAFEEYGVRPKSQKEKGISEEARWENARALASVGDFDNIPSDIMIRYVGNLQRIHCLAVEKAYMPDLDHLDNHWFWGSSGAGKSRFARESFPDAYLKSKNKWWNGYQNQAVVIIDDVDPSMEWIGSFLKEWADHYRFQGETKGGARVIRPQQIIVTSQYAIQDCFKEGETVSALERRFQSRHFGVHAFNPSIQRITGDMF